MVKQNIARENPAAALQSAFDGTRMDRYRDGLRVLPILARAPQDERADVGNLQDLNGWSPMLEQTVAVAPVVSAFETVWERTR